MTDKPDVAALVEWLQTWSPVTENGQRAHLAASELTRLAAENRTYAEAHVFNSERFVEMLSERDEAKAEIARLREWKTAAENLIAAIRLDSGIAYPWPALDLADEALKPDTVSQRMSAAGSHGYFKPLKPDTPRQYSIGELAAAVTLAKANLVGGPELDKQFKAYVEAVEATLKPGTGE